MSSRWWALGCGLLALGAAIGIALRGPSPWLGPVTEDLAPPPLRVPAAASADREMRVAVSGKVLEIRLSTVGPFRVLALKGGTLLLEGRRLESTRISATARAIRFGSKEWPHSAVEIVPQQSPGVWVGETLYRGRLRLHRLNERVLAVNVLPLEDYVAAVVDSEMPALFPLEARKAQAIVSRTFAVYQQEASSADALNDLVAGVRSQNYLGYQYRKGGKLLAGETAAGRKAAAETRGLVCTLQGTPFCTYYSAVCGGRTLTGTEVFDDAAPALVSVPCEFCRDAERYRWSTTIPRTEVFADLQRYLSSRGQSLGTIRSLRSLGSAEPGRLSEFEVLGSDRAVINGFELRLALLSKGVASSRFSIAERDGKLIFSGQGHGHGAGLCQWGARGMAVQGRSAQQIVTHYYPGATVEPLRE